MGVLRGRVFADGQPLPEITVVIKSMNGHIGTRSKTNADGVFETRALDAGDYKLAVTHGGFARFTLDVHALPEGDDIHDLYDIVLLRFGSISGKITDGHAGVRDARAVASSRADSSVFRSKLTGDDGGYAIPAVPPESYDLAVEPPAGFDPGDPMGVKVGPGVDAQLDLMVTPTQVEWSISGKVLDDAGQPIAGAGIAARDQAGVDVPPVMTGATGAFQIANLPSETYTLTVSFAGYASAALDVQVNGADVAAGDVQLQRAAITGRVLDLRRQPALNVQVRAYAYDVGNQPVGAVAVPQAPDGSYVLTGVLDGLRERFLRVQVEDQAGVRHADYLPAANVRVSAGTTTERIDFSVEVVEDFLGRLDDTRFSLDSVVTLDEARQAVSLFAIVTLMLAGHTQRSAAGEQTDVLGMQRLLAGLQDGSLQRALTLDDPARVWNALQGQDGDLSSLPNLARQLGQMQAEIEVLHREARRQFNLGLSNGVVANVRFPSLFRRYVEIAADPLLALNLRDEAANPATDAARLNRAYDLLVELKATIIEMARSLSRHGTIATTRLNQDWAHFQRAAMEALAIVAQARISSDQDRNQWEVLATLTGRNREREIAPYVALARHGTKLLSYALSIYDEERETLGNYDRDHLRDRFQAQDGTSYWTQRLRTEASLVRSYPLQDWG